jgi:hypothetical protein
MHKCLCLWVSVFEATTTSASFTTTTVGTTPAPTAMYGCTLGATTAVQRDVAYDIRCQHDVNTQNVTWTFTSSGDQSTSVLVQCMVYSRNPDVHCRSLLPYFNIARPDFMYTSLQVVWDLLPQSMTQGVLACSLDQASTQVCRVVIDTQAGKCFLESLHRRCLV